MYIDDITDMISNEKRKISEIIFEIRSKKHHQRNTIKQCMTKAAEEAAASECRRMEK